jgi:hypothetical protein
MGERLAPAAYLAELKKLQATISEATSRAKALDNEEEKPVELTVGVDLRQLAYLLERAEERAQEAVRSTELLFAVKGLQLEEGGADPE